MTHIQRSEDLCWTVRTYNEAKVSDVRTHGDLTLWNGDILPNDYRRRGRRRSRRIARRRRNVDDRTYGLK